MRQPSLWSDEGRSVSACVYLLAAGGLDRVSRRHRERIRVPGLLASVADPVVLSLRRQLGAVVHTFGDDGPITVLAIHLPDSVGDCSVLVRHRFWWRTGPSETWLNINGTLRFDRTLYGPRAWRRGERDALKPVGPFEARRLWGSPHVEAMSPKRANSEFLGCADFSCRFGLSLRGHTLCDRLCMRTPSPRSVSVTNMPNG